MLLHEEIGKKERNKRIKTIERHLKNYSNYKVALLNLTKQLEFISSNHAKKNIFSEQHRTLEDSLEKLSNELKQIKIVKDSIDASMSELTELEGKFVEYRYFNNWSIEKSALEIGYSDKALFVIRQQVMDKLLISLGSVTFM
ncbi:uncharacterized protein YjcR [Rossellomorea marisflavi]